MGYYDNDFDPYAPPQADLRSKGTKHKIGRATDFTIGEVLSRSWQILRSRLFTVIGAVFLSFIVGSILSGVGQAMQPADPNAAPNLPGVLLALAGMFVSVFMNCGLFTFLLNLASGRNAQITDIFSGGSIFIKVLLASLTLGVMYMGLVIVVALLMVVLTAIAPPLAILGAMAAAVMGILFFTRYSQFYYLLADREVGPVESIKLSSQIMQGRTLQFMGLMLVNMLVNICGLLALVVGLFVTIPLSLVTTAVFYLAATGQPVADPYGFGGETAEDLV